jgi:lipoate-protein ligase A
MFFWEHAYPTPEANLAFDEAVLEHMETLATTEGELLRVWEMPERCVVIGRSSKVALEVNQVTCQQDRVPVLRRMSGGASIVAGPGCLMFSLLLSLEKRPEYRGLDGAHRSVMTRMANAVESALGSIGSNYKVGIQGICDLTIGGRKISGNALRIKRHWMIYHGTLLVDMPLEWIDRYLLEPPKQPEYRQRREHRDFVESLGHSLQDRSQFVSEFYRCSRSEWEAHEPWSDHPFALLHETSTREWIQRRYGDPAWHMQR